MIDDVSSFRISRKIVTLQLSPYPCGVVAVVTVTVVAVIHDLPVLWQAQQVQLPEYHTAVATHAQLIACCGMLHLLLSQIAHTNTSSAEHAVVAPVLHHHIAVAIHYQVLSSPFLPFLANLLLEPPHPQPWTVNKPLSHLLDFRLFSPICHAAIPRAGSPPALALPLI